MPSLFLQEKKKNKIVPSAFAFLQLLQPLPAIRLLGMRIADEGGCFGIRLLRRRIAGDGKGILHYSILYSIVLYYIVLWPDKSGAFAFLEFCLLGDTPTKGTYRRRLWMLADTPCEEAYRRRMMMMIMMIMTMLAFCFAFCFLLCFLL